LEILLEIEEIHSLPFAESVKLLPIELPIGGNASENDQFIVTDGLKSVTIQVNR
jgi:hypothetical protein